MNAKRNDPLTFNARTSCRRKPASRAYGRWFWTPAFAGVTFFLSITTPVFARSNAAIKAFNSGVQAFNTHNYREAIPYFDSAIENDAEFPEALFARGACKYYLKSLDGALADLNTTLRLKPEYLDAQALRGAIYYETEEWDDALTDFNTVLTQKPKDAQSLLGRAVIRLKRQELAGAEKDFIGFLQVRPDDPLAPKVREVLASLKRVKSSESEVDEVPRPGPADDHPTARRRPPAAPSTRMSHADIQKLTEALFGRQLSDAYGRKVIRGEKSEAVGDIRNVPGMAQPQ